MMKMKACKYFTVSTTVLLLPKFLYIIKENMIRMKNIINQQNYTVKTIIAICRLTACGINIRVFV